MGSEGGGRRFLYLQKSQLIHEHPHRRVSLVKVNVERAEEDVLMGVETRHWPLIDQVGSGVQTLPHWPLINQFGDKVALSRWGHIMERLVLRLRM